MKKNLNKELQRKLFVCSAIQFILPKRLSKCHSQIPRLSYYKKIDVIQSNDAKNLFNSL